MTFRNVIEMSSMSNNEEYVFYSERRLTREEAKAYPAGPFSQPRLVLSRELRRGETLDTAFRGPSFQEGGVSDLTKLLDALEKVTARRQFENEIGINRSQTKFVAHWLAYAYYDCLSGGMPGWEVAIFRYLCESELVDKDEAVYPGEDGSARADEHVGWYTISDWLKSTAECRSLRDFLESHQLQLPSPEALLPGKEAASAAPTRQEAEPG